ncbi:MAG: SocA family protein [Planctomycetes bacterium]|nr:SocA family protein [Planctomycetota bacterium]
MNEVVQKTKPIPKIINSMTDLMTPHYREEKAIAVAATLLHLSGGKGDKYWLNKLMYYIERQSLVKSGQPLYFDVLCSVPWGPIVSNVNDGIDSAATSAGSPWAKYFSLENKTVTLKSAPDYSCLSEFEEIIIRETYEKFRDWDFNRLHTYFSSLPEYKETKSREDINYSDILIGEGFAPEDIQEALKEISYLGFLETVLHCTH